MQTFRVDKQIGLSASQQIVRGRLECKLDSIVDAFKDHNE